MMNDRNRFRRHGSFENDILRDMEVHRRDFNTMRSAFPWFFGFVFLLIVGIFIANIVFTAQGRNPCDNPFNTRDYRCIGYYNHGQQQPVQPVGPVIR